MAENANAGAGQLSAKIGQLEAERDAAEQKWRAAANALASVYHAVTGFDPAGMDGYDDTARQIVAAFPRRSSVQEAAPAGTSDAPDYESAARFLFDLLDDIDTVSDAARDNNKAYRDAVERIQRRRFEVATVDDAGVKVVFKTTARAVAPAGVPEESDLRALMHDPRYWRDRDPAVIATVEEGFRRLLSAAPTAQGQSKALEDIAAERRRQIEVEGWTPEHDDQHSNGWMATAAACYILNGAGSPNPAPPNAFPTWWPWASRWWKPKDRRSDLVRAGALIAAEIERLDRSSATSAPSAGEA